MEAILAERSTITAVIRASGVPARDRADVEQRVLMGAWNSIRRGLYRPSPADDPRKALRGWLYSVARHLSMHHVNSAWVRRAVIHPSPFGLLHEAVGPDLHAQIEARQVLEALAELKPWQREALLVVDQPDSLVAYARSRGMHPGTAASRLRIAREALALRLRRWRR
ncbi:RNA polymerase sigma factor [Sorangium sp. So ce118]